MFASQASRFTTALLLASSSAFADPSSAIHGCNEKAKEQQIPPGNARMQFMSRCLRENTTPPEPTAANLPEVHPANPVRALLGDGALAAFTVTLAGTKREALESYAQEISNLSAIGQRADSDVEAAVKFAHGRQDLTLAIKEYYSAVAALVSGGVPNNRIEQLAADHARADLDAKGKRLELEARLAKVN